MHGRITPPLVIEPPRVIQILKILGISLAAIEIQGRNLKVAPEMAEIVIASDLRITHRGGFSAVNKETKRVVGGEELRIAGDEFFGACPQGFDGRLKFVHGDHEAVCFFVGAHEGKRVAVGLSGLRLAAGMRELK